MDGEPKRQEPNFGEPQIQLKVLRLLRVVDGLKALDPNWPIRKVGHRPHLGGRESRDLNEGQVVEYEEVANKGKTSAENLKVQR
jgi:hypothetical protein